MDAIRLIFIALSCGFLLLPASASWADSKVWSIHPVVQPTARLDGVRAVADRRCGTGQVLVEETFSVAGYDPVELLLVREPEVGPILRQPVQWVDSAGRIVHTYCADRTLDTTVKSWFLRYDGHATPALGYRIQLRDQPVAAAATPVFPLHVKTRFQQFATKEQPDQGTCCWHYIHAHLSPPTSEAMHALAIPLNIAAAPPVGSHVYLQFYIVINGIKLYVGLQTDLKRDHKSQGPGVIFSRWDTQDPADFRIAPGGFSEIGSHEGRFVGVRQPIDWSAPGRWTLRLTTRDPEPGSDPNHFWLEASLERPDGKEGRPLAVGALRFPGREARLTSDLVVTVESYSMGSTGHVNLWQLPRLDFLMQTPQFNGKTIPPTARITYPANAPRIITATMQGDGIRFYRDGLLP